MRGKEGRNREETIIRRRKNIRKRGRRRKEIETKTMKNTEEIVVRKMY